MRAEDILHWPSMPLASPSYPKGPYRFVDREYMVITSETDPEVIRHQLPEPLEPLDQPLVSYEWINMPDSSGFGSYTESGLVIPCKFQGEDVNFVSQMYLDDDPPIAGGRGIWGFPKKYAHPKLKVFKDTLSRDFALWRAASSPWARWAMSESMAGNRRRHDGDPVEDADQSQDHPRGRRRPRHLPAGCLQSHRNHGKRLVDRCGTAASRAARECPRRRLSGAPYRRRTPFHRRSEPALWPHRPRLSEAIN